MKSVEEALQILSDHKHDFGIEVIDLDDCIGLILREEIIADRDMPPFDRVSMDGIAIRFEGYERGIRNFPIIGMAGAGSPQQILVNATDCYEIMTGSISPAGADSIIPYEWIKIENDTATVEKGNVTRGQNIHLRGTDRKSGDTLIQPGRSISASEVGVLSSVGKGIVKVSRNPKVMIISTGNELVEIDQDPLPHQVRMSNVYQLQAAFRQMKMESDRSHLQDDYDLIVRALEAYINTYDVVVISGGISEGKYDYIPSALESLGVVRLFYKISQRPGKPFWFGKHPNGCTVFGVPGNPVSSFLCYIRYIKPWIESCVQKESAPQQVAVLSEDVSFAPGLTYFLTVRLEQTIDGVTLAIPVKGHGSGDLSNLADVDAFIELPREREFFRKGEVFVVFRFNQ